MSYLILSWGVLASAYPAFVVIRPDVAARIRVRSTQKARLANRRTRQALGEWFQRFLRVDATGEPSQDKAADKQVRFFGLVELVIVWLVVGAVLSL